MQSMGIAMGPDGSMYFAETEKGRIWRVKYKGDKKTFGQPQLASMELRKSATNIRTPDINLDNLDRNDTAMTKVGEKLYTVYCGACHQPNGMGGTMPRHDFLKDEDIANILTYIRKNFGNQADAVTTDEVKAQRDKIKSN